MLSFMYNYVAYPRMHKIDTKPKRFVEYLNQTLILSHD